MEWGKRTYCLEDGPQRKPIRAQCDDKTKICPYSSACQRLGTGKRCVELERVQHCMYPPSPRKGPDLRTRQAWEQAGFTFVQAIAESPPGWMRDERGRVFQVNFDLHRRVYIGARWPYSLGPGGGQQLGRVGLETGMRAEWLTSSLRTRLRLIAFESEVMLNPLSLKATLVRMDSSHESATPFLRLTTFWPRPKRHDMYLNLGWAFEAAAVEHAPRTSIDETVIRIAGGGVTLDLWHDTDLSSYVRLRTGVAFDYYTSAAAGVRDRTAVVPMIYGEGDITFDRNGMHHLTFQTGWESPLVFLEGVDGVPIGLVNRFNNEVAYEVILLAINDQPLTLRAAVGGGYRDDLAGAPAGWELTAGVGLRVSFWAPARDLKALERAEALYDD